MLARHVHAALKGDAEKLWAVKRSLAMQLAATSLLCHAFTVTERQPARFVFSPTTGRFLATEFRPGYTSHGHLEASEEVPFRLTRNIYTLLSPLLVDGAFASAMAATALALSEKAPVLKPYLVLLLRDDLVCWHAGKGQPKSDAEQQAFERQLADRVAKNATRVLDRVHTAAPRVSPPNSTTGHVPRHEHRVDHIVHRLIEAAAHPERLCHMNPTWMPWL